MSTKNPFKNSIWQLALEKYYPRVYNTIYFITRDHNITEDITQEAFLIAIEKHHQLRDSEKFLSWLTSIAINLTNKQFNAKKELSLFDPNFIMDSFQEGNFPLEYAEVKETQCAIKKAISQLPPQEQRFVVLRYYCGMREQEIADILKVSIGTVKKSLFRARIKLNNALKDWFSGGDSNER